MNTTPQQYPPEPACDELRDEAGLRDDEMMSWGQFLRPPYLAPLLFVSLGTSLYTLANYIIAVAIPGIVADIGGVSWVSWITALFTGSAMISVLGAATFVQRFGLRIPFYVSAITFVAGSVIAALSPNMLVLLIGRAMEGAGSGLVIGLGVIYIRRSFRAPDWPKAFAAFSVAFGVSTIIGPMVGGILADYEIWRTGFWLLAGLGTLFGSIALIVDVVPKVDRDRNAVLPTRRLMLFAAVVLLVLGSNQLFDPKSIEDLGRWLLFDISAWTGLSMVKIINGLTIAVLASAVGLFILLLRLDRGRRNALLPPDPFSLRTVQGRGNLFIFVIAATTIAFFTYGPLLLHKIFDLSSTFAGFVVVLEAMSWSLAAIVVASFSDKWAGRCMRLGPVITSLGLVAMAYGFGWGKGSLYLIIIGSGLAGLGMGMAFANVTRAIVESSPEDQADRASGGVITLQLLGYALGAALSGLIANKLGISEPDANLHQIGAILIGCYIPPALFATWHVTKLRLANE